MRLFSSFEKLSPSLSKDFYSKSYLAEPVSEEDCNCFEERETVLRVVEKNCGVDLFLHCYPYRYKAARATKDAAKAPNLA